MHLERADGVLGGVLDPLLSVLRVLRWDMCQVGYSAAPAPAPASVSHNRESTGEHIQQHVDQHQGMLNSTHAGVAVAQ